MVSGTTWPHGDPFLQRQNEPSIAVSTRNQLHLLAGANDYRTVDLPGFTDDRTTGDAWIGVFTSYDGGATWRSTLMPGYPQDPDRSAPLWGFEAGADPTVRAGPNGLFFYSGIVFDRTTPEVTGRVKRSEHEHLAGANGATNALYLARFIDNNNKENGEPIVHLETKVLATNLPTKDFFIDKPWLAVDIPRKKPGMCTITQWLDNQEVTQSVLAFNVYVAYSVFSGSGSSLIGRVFFTRSTDCGATWSTPVQISAANHLNQGVSVVLDPRTGTVYASWRRFAWPRSSQQPSETDAILMTRSRDGGVTFTPPEVLATINPFDQTTKSTEFRTNSYPTTAVDRRGNVYVAWAQRGVGPGGDARIVLSRARYRSRLLAILKDDDDDDGSESSDPSDLKATWSAPTPINNQTARGHQVMPSMILTGGKVQIAYVDLRDDHTWGEFSVVNGAWVEKRVASSERSNPNTVGRVFNQWIDDVDPQTRRHTIDIWVAQAFAVDGATFKAQRVSSYAAGSRPGSTTVEQMQFNPPNLPLFRQGTNAFAGDYLDLGAVAFEPWLANRWRQARTGLTGGTSFVAFTDNRDVRPPKDGDWSKYTPPSSPALDPNGTFFPGTSPQQCDPQYPERAGMRNQNIYLARVTQGLFVGAPGNAKPLDRIQRAFVVWVQNDTGVQKTFRLSIPQQPSGGAASFLQFSTTTQLDVSVLPRSSISRTVFVTAGDAKESVRVDVKEVAGGQIVPVLQGGLQDSVLLNPDIMNPDIMNPDIMNPDIMNPDIMNAEVYNPDIMNPDIMNPDIMNWNIVNPDIMNPDIMNPDIMNPEVANKTVTNPDIMNPDIMNPDIMNPDIMNPDIMNGSITDTVWTITNTGNTTSAYNMELLMRGSNQVPAGFKTQLIVLKTYTTPVSKNCQLMEESHNVVIASIPNPRFTPAANYTGVDPTDGSVKRATLWLAPGETGKIVLRVVDPNRSDTFTFNAAEAVAPIISGQSVNTEDAAAGSTTPPSATVLLASFMQGPTTTPIGGIVTPPVSVLVKDNKGNPVNGVKVSLKLAVNPSNAAVHGNAAITDVTGVASFPGLWADRLGTGDALVVVPTAGSPGITSQVSSAFNVVPLVVTTTVDSGPGSLRRAIENANRNTGQADSASFAIPGSGVHTIALASPLPVITDPITLDATTQPGYAGVPLVRLDGAGLSGSVNGIDVQASNSLVQGFMVTRFSGFGIRVTIATATSITKNFVGTDGTSALGNGQAGIFVTNGSSTQIIGNLISGNGTDGVFLNGGTGTVIKNNTIGTDAAATMALGNARDGVGIHNNSSDNTISDNVIAASTYNGIRVANAAGNKIRHNWVGTNAALAPGLGNGFDAFGNVQAYGISVASSSNTTIGGTNPGDANIVAGNGWGIGLEAATTVTQILGNVVSGNKGGIDVFDSQNATISGNLIGTNLEGTAAWANVGACGISLVGATTTGITIGGTTPGAGNVASGNKPYGICLFGGAHHNRVVGNKIGTDLNGAFAIPNSNLGVWLDNVHDNTIGGTATGEGNTIEFNTGAGVLSWGAWTNQIIGNVISGNGVNGITLDNATYGTVIASNKIGTNATGTAALGNTGDGIGIYHNSHDNTISDNVIAASTYNGIRVANGTGNTIQHNWVGTNAALAPGLGNLNQGISVASSSNTTIGGSTGLGNVVAGNVQGGIGLEGASTLTQILGNVVSGNSGPGIGVIDSQNATITGNRIGTNPAGTAAWANAADGISVSGATTSWTTIGGSTSGAGNVISGNTGNGIAVGGATLTMIWGNLIGTDAGGTLPLPNVRSGVSISASNNHIGDELPYPPEVNGNVIAFNGAYGIEVVSGTQNDIASNRIFANGSLGIYLGTGANHGLNAPVITSAVDDGADTVITGTGTFTDPTTTMVWLDFFVNAACDSSGYGEGETLLGHTLLHDLVGGFFSFEVRFPRGHVGQMVTATTQDFDGTWSGDTSQFSACVTVVGP